MEIKELSFMKNLSEDGKKTSEMDSVIGGHSHSRSYQRSYDYGHGYSHIYSHSYSREYVPPSYFVKEIEVIEPKDTGVSFYVTPSYHVPKYPSF